MAIASAVALTWKALVRICVLLVRLVAAVNVAIVASAPSIAALFAAAAHYLRLSSLHLDRLSTAHAFT